MKCLKVGMLKEGETDCQGEDSAWIVVVVGCQACGRIRAGRPRAFPRAVCVGGVGGAIGCLGSWLPCRSSLLESLGKMWASNMKVRRSQGSFWGLQALFGTSAVSLLPWEVLIWTRSPPSPSWQVESWSSLRFGGVGTGHCFLIRSGPWLLVEFRTCLLTGEVFSTPISLPSSLLVLLSVFFFPSGVVWCIGFPSVAIVRSHKC